MISEEEIKKLSKAYSEKEMDKYEYALFKITDKEKFCDFMLKYLSMKNDTLEFGYRVQVLGCGKEPFEWGKYTEYLEKVGATNTQHQFYLNLDEWIQMGRPDEESNELSEKIEKELC